MGAKGMATQQTKSLVQRRGWIVLSLILSLGILFYYMAPVLTPFLVAGILAYLCDPLVYSFVRLKCPRTLAVCLVFLLLLAFVLSLILILLPLLEHQVANFLGKIPDMLQWVQVDCLPYINQHLNLNLTLDPAHIKAALPKDWSQASSWFSYLSQALFRSSKTLLLGVANLLLIPVVLFYLLRDWPRILQGCLFFIPHRYKAKVKELARECDDVLGAFLRGQLLVMLALGALYSIGLALMGLNTSLVIGLSAGFLSIVPYLGFIVGIGAALIGAAFQFHDLWHLTYVMIIFIVVQSIEGSVLTPNLVGDKIGLHPVAVIFSVLAGGQLFGFFGILLALPVAAVAMVFIRHLQAYYLKSKLYRL